MSFYFKQGHGTFSYRVRNAGAYVHEIHELIREDIEENDGENLVVAPDKTPKDLSSLR